MHRHRDQRCLPRGSRRPTKARRVDKAAIAEELAGLLGSANVTEQASIIRTWLREWRRGETDCPLSPRTVVRSRGQATDAKPNHKANQRAAILGFLTWKLRRPDLALEASNVLRRQEKHLERLLSYCVNDSQDPVILVRPDDADCEPTFRARHKPRLLTLGGSDTYETGWGDVFFSVWLKDGRQYSELTNYEKSKYACFVWSCFWNYSHREDLPTTIGRKCRRSLLAILEALKQHPESAIRRLITLGRRMPEPCDGTLSGAAGIKRLTTQCDLHLRRSGIKLSCPTAFSMHQGHTRPAEDYEE